MKQWFDVEFLNLLCLFFNCMLLMECVNVSTLSMCVLAGINEQGLYRVPGVSSKVPKLLLLMIGEDPSLIILFLI